MARKKSNRMEAFGKAPGSLVFIGSRMVEEVKVDVITFDHQELKEYHLDVEGEKAFQIPEGRINWVNVVGVHDGDFIQHLGQQFDLHPLLLENVMNTSLRPRLEEYENCLFMNVNMLRYDEEEEEVLSEHISLIMREGLVITFQEAEGDVFEPVRERLRTKRGRIRKQGADYLAFALLDIIFDHYIITVERFGEVIEEVEDDILKNPTPEVLEKINFYKGEINLLRKNIRPAREMAFQFAKLESPLIVKGTRQFLKELAANSVQASEVVDGYSSLLTDFLQVYHTSISNKTNDVMKVLTIFAAIFIPLTFVAGVYGTNFDYIPELGWEYSYPIFWGVLLVIGFIMLRYFRRKGWL